MDTNFGNRRGLGTGKLYRSVTKNILNFISIKTISNIIAVMPIGIARNIYSPGSSNIRKSAPVGGFAIP